VDALRLIVNGGRTKGNPANRFSQRTPTTAQPTRPGLVAPELGLDLAFTIVIAQARERMARWFLYLFVAGHLGMHPRVQT
jgi:hypothetical protein